MVLRYRIINRSRDCRLFWTGLPGRCIVVTIKLRRSEETGSREKFRVTRKARMTLFVKIFLSRLNFLQIPLNFKLRTINEFTRRYAFFNRTERTAFFSDPRWLLGKHSHSTHVTFDKIAVKPHFIKSRFVKSFKDPRRFAKSVTLKRG